MKSFIFCIVAGVVGGSIAACGGDDTPTNDTTVLTSPPIIAMVEWTHTPGCSVGTASDVMIVVTVTDADAPANMLTYSGSVTACTGAIDAMTSSVSCPQLVAYASTATVTDADNNSDTLNFSIDACIDGSATP